jgi:hypothetical protein
MRKKPSKEKLPAVSYGPLKELPPEVKQKEIVINTFRSEYPLIDEVAVQVMGWQVSKEEDWSKGEFDLIWNDLGVESALLASLKCY